VGYPSEVEQAQSPFKCARSNIGTEDISERSAILGDIWPQLIQANNVVETYGQLERRYVIFAKAAKSFAMVGKSVVNRKATVGLYAKDINELYDLYASVAIAGLKGLFRMEGLST
jgi:hypothetical protein